jgi:hypothetical protein
MIFFPNLAHFKFFSLEFGGFLRELSKLHEFSENSNIKISEKPFNTLPENTITQILSNKSRFDKLSIKLNKNAIYLNKLTLIPSHSRKFK